MEDGQPSLLLATVGLYGLVSYGASQRVREMGIRIALGARPESLVRLILARGRCLIAQPEALPFIRYSSHDDLRIGADA